MKPDYSDSFQLLFLCFFNHSEHTIHLLVRFVQILHHPILRATRQALLTKDIRIYSRPILWQHESFRKLELRYGYYNIRDIVIDLKIKAKPSTFLVYKITYSFVSSIQTLCTYSYEFRWSLAYITAREWIYFFRKG